MTKDTHRDRRPRGGNLAREVQVSKALSRLLRHAAVQERIPIDSHGYVRMDYLLGWQRLRSMKPAVTFAEVVEVVRQNEKQRFGLRYESDAGPGQGIDLQDAQGEEKAGEAEPEAQGTESETRRAIAKFESGGDLEPKHYSIRATQGHSMKNIEAENLLTPIVLENPDTIPDTVVHGTFYGAWASILRDGGLKKMSRNHVHFAMGPALKEVLPSSTGDDQGKGGSEAGEILYKNQVISGMRSDAQILIYVDIRRALREEGDRMKWWRSENGVVLTEGVDVEGKGEQIVPMKYWDVVVEVKERLGPLWRHGEGVVQELPERLRSKGVPRGKGGSGRQRGGGRHPKLKVERDDMVHDEQ